MGKRRQGHRQWLPLAYVAAAMVAAAVVLPSSLRPPPDQANSSGAINPNAPPNQNPAQLLESLQEAGGGGAGAGVGTSTTTTAPPVGTASGATAPATTVPPVASLGYCYGNPPRQIPSVYSGPCVGAWHGDNGGATSKNVFPNQINIGLNQSGGVQDNAGTYTVLAQYFNTHFQFYNRKVNFVAINDPTSFSSSDQAAAATQYETTNRLFVLGSNYEGACIDFVQAGMVAICNQEVSSVYEQNRPGLFSWYMPLDEVTRMGAEYVCKTLVGRPAKFAGPGTQGAARRFGVISYQGLDDGVPGTAFAAAVKATCGITVDAATEQGTTDAQGAASAIARFRADGVTTIVMMTAGTSMIATYEAASKSAYYPEWVGIGLGGMDQDFLATAFLPADELKYTFGISSGFYEWPQVPAATECYEAYHTIDPTGNPASTACDEYWPTLVLIMDGIQGAGPDLTPATFQAALERLGYRYGQTPWAIGGGIGPGHWGYADDAAEIWWDPSAREASANNPGAYRWTHGGLRFRLGQFPGDDSQLFRSGATDAPEG